MTCVEFEAEATATRSRSSGRGRGVPQKPLRLRRRAAQRRRTRSSGRTAYGTDAPEVDRVVVEYRSTTRATADPMSMSDAVGDAANNHSQYPDAAPADFDGGCGGCGVPEVGPGSLTRGNRWS